MDEKQLRVLSLQWLKQLAAWQEAYRPMRKFTDWSIKVVDLERIIRNVADTKEVQDLVDAFIVREHGGRKFSPTLLEVGIWNTFLIKLGKALNEFNEGITFFLSYKRLRHLDHPAPNPIDVTVQSYIEAQAAV
jgi:hypothetical protein